MSPARLRRSLRPTFEQLEVRVVPHVDPLDPGHALHEAQQFQSFQIGTYPPVDPSLSGADTVSGSGSTAAGTYPLSVPAYSSRPGAKGILYLDFDGDFVASWRGYSNISTPAYDTDGDATTFSDTELANIQKIWQQVAEDYYVVRAFNDTASSDFSNQASATTVPAAPSNLTATAISAGRIDLTWSDVAGETGYKIERSTNGSTWTQIATTGANVTSYSNTSLAASTTYYYRVRASNAGGDSDYSNTASATTPALPSPPAAPSNLTATIVSASQNRLNWTDNSGNETGFYIERSHNNGKSWNRIGQVGANLTSFTDSTANQRKTDLYRVQAFNEGGVSAYSNTATETSAASRFRVMPGAVGSETSPPPGAAANSRGRSVASSSTSATPLLDLLASLMSKPAQTSQRHGHDHSQGGDHDDLSDRDLAFLVRDWARAPRKLAASRNQSKKDGHDPSPCHDDPFAATTLWSLA